MTRKKRADDAPGGILSARSVKGQACHLIQWQLKFGTLMKARDAHLGPSGGKQSTAARGHEIQTPFSSRTEDVVDLGSAAPGRRLRGNFNRAKARVSVVEILTIAGPRAGRRPVGVRLATLPTATTDAEPDRHDGSSRAERRQLNDGR
jgi:hypothetical protein